MYRDFIYYSLRLNHTMNKTATFAILGAILAVASLGLAAIVPMEAHAFNFQNNYQGFDNFNNQQKNSNFQCQAVVYACSP